MVEWKIGNDIANAYDEGYEQGKNDAVKHGHWMHYIMGKWVYAKCSVCGTVHDVSSNYCPNCGARMDEE